MNDAHFSVDRLQLVQYSLANSNLLLNGAYSNPQGSYQQALTAQQANAPVFGVSISGPGVYAGVDGKSYLVPTARIAYRANLPQTPSISFRTDGRTWTMLMTVELFRPAGTDPSVVPLLMDNYRVQIVPGDGTATFAFTTVTPLDAPADSVDVVGVLMAEGVVDETRALALLSGSPNAYLTVVGTLNYQLQRKEIVRNPGPDPDPGPRPGPFPLMEKVEPGLGVEDLRLPDNELVASNTHLQDLTPYFDVPHKHWGGIGGVRIITVVTGMTVDQTLTPGNSVHACFPSSLRDFKPIYAAIMGTGSDGTVWSQETGQGYSRPMASADGYEVLPDAFSLAIDPATGLPSMSVLLVTTPPATPGGVNTYSVRVRLAVAPLLDGARLERIRGAVRRSARIPYATLVIGGYASAVFVPSSMFSSVPGVQGGIVGGTGGSPQIDASNGFELVMDCSLDFYTLLTKLLSTAGGMQGSVQFQIVTAHVDSTPPVDATFLVSIPVCLSFLGPFPVPLTTQIDPEQPVDPADATLTLSITNPLPVPVTITGIFPTLLENDSDLQTITGAAVLAPTQNSLTLDGAATAKIVLNAADGKPLPAYSSLNTTYGTVTPTFDPAAVLGHYHELAGGVGVATTVHFECYLLKHPDQIPSTLANLEGMQIQIQRNGGPTIDVPLSRDVPAADINLSYSFAELLAGLSLDEPTFQYRAASVYVAGPAGPYSDWISNTGRSVLVTPM